MHDSSCMEKLTDREIEVFQLLADGCSNKQIADNLGITIRTVKFHTANIYEKIEVGSRSTAIVWAWRNQKGIEES